MTGPRIWLPWALAAACAATLACGSPPPEDDETEVTAAPAPTTPWFTDVSAEVGLDFVHESGGVGDLHLPEIMGSGAGFLDYDGDGDLDVYLVNANFDFAGDAGAGRAAPTNRLFAQGDDGRLVDVTATAGVGDTGYGMGMAVGDYDNDGDTDLYVTNLGEDRLYRNRGDGSFEEVSVRAGAATDGWSTSAIFVDYDEDGWLDLYVTRYVTYDAATKCFDFAGRHEYCGPTAFNAESDVLLHNEGDGTFSDRSRQAGIAAIADAGLGVACADFDGDGRVDVYVANDADPNQLWINNGDGTFTDRGALLGASVNSMGAAEAGMGVVAADLDNDLDVDLFMTHLENESNTLYLNLGGGVGFEDATAAAGLATSSMERTGFGTTALDVELDGDLDLYLVNGRVVRGALVAGELVPPWSDYAEPNLFYYNDGSAAFTLAGTEMDTLTRPVEITRAATSGDFDRDGDLDLLLSNTQGRARLLRNDAPRRGHWLIVEAVEPLPERPALGARVTVHAGEQAWTRTVSAGSGYLSSQEPIAHFGLGGTSTIDRIVVDWPGRGSEAFAAESVDRRLRLVRGQGTAP